jgi:hypothetical protein
VQENVLHSLAGVRPCRVFPNNPATGPKIGEHVHPILRIDHVHREWIAIAQIWSCMVVESICGSARWKIKSVQSHGTVKQIDH